MAAGAVDVLLRFPGAWGLGDLVCAEPMLTGLVERHGPATRLWLAGKVGNLIHHPHVCGMASPDRPADVVVDVRPFTHMPLQEYARLEALPSLVEHMCSYADVRPSSMRPRLHLGPREAEFLAASGLTRLRAPRIAICADRLDPLRHWPVDRWAAVATALRAAGATVLELGVHDRLGVGHDLVGKLDVRQSAAVVSACSLYLGNNSGLFHYAQAVDTPCVTLFSLAAPERFIHPGATVRPVQAAWLPCIDCMTRRFAEMQSQGCIAAPRGRCMLEIGIEDVLEAALEALEAETALSRARGKPAAIEPNRCVAGPSR